jgi:hypothetical protein
MFLFVFCCISDKEVRYSGTGKGEREALLAWRGEKGMQGDLKGREQPAAARHRRSKLCCA